MKMPNKRELEQLALNQFSDIEKYYNKESFSFLVNNTTLSSDNTLRFGQNLL